MSRAFVVIVLGLFFCGGIMSGIAVSESPRWGNPWIGAAVGLLMVPTGLLAGLALLTVLYAIHEAGHLSAMRVFGWKCTGIQLLFLSIACPNGKWRARWTWSAEQGSGTTFVPKRATANQGLIVLLAGPASSLAAAAAFWGFSLKVTQDWSWLFVLAAMLSTVVGLMALTPFTLGRGVVSDGAQIGLFLRQKDLYETWLDVLELHGLTANMRPRDVKPQNLAPWKNAESYVAYLSLTRFWVEMDAGNVVAAGREIETAWARIESLQALRPCQAMLAFETSMYFTRFVDDEQLAATSFGFGLASDPVCTTRKALEAARLYMKGKVEEARQVRDEVLKTCQSESDPPPYRLSHVADWFNRILDPTIPTLTREESEAAIARGDYPRLLEPLTPEPQSA